MTFVDLEDVTSFRIPGSVAERTLSQLRRYGKRGLEARVLWAGTPVDERTVRIDRSVLPQQKCTPWLTIVEHPEILRVCRELYDHGLTLVGQVHTHPAETFHSDIDDDEPITTQRGSLSVVVPNYGDDPVGDLEHWAVYRLGEDGWGLVEPTSSILELLPGGGG